MDRNEAIRRIRAWNLDSDDMEVLEELIPELKENEDDRIRKALIWCVETIEGELGCKDAEGIAVAELKSWLERQGSQNLANFTKTCKVEPKFKVGDWIISDEAHEDYRICKITNVENGNYTIESIYGYKGYNTFETFEKRYHLWTIQDAKDGDVLTEHETIVLFKEIDGLNIRCYCTYHYLGYNPDLHVDTLQNKKPYYPATEEERDLLFRKIKEAGYEWDAEKKELRKIEQKPVPITDEWIEDYWKHNKVNNPNSYDKGDEIQFDHDGFVRFCNKYFQKPAWSEEDERVINSIIKNLDEGEWFDIYQADWLKSLKRKIHLEVE